MFSRIDPTRRAFLLSLVALSFGIASCQPQTPTAPSADTNAPSSPAANTGGESVTLNGAGASFPAPLYQRWFSEYNKVNPNTKISYQSVGSGAGVKQFTAGTIDFGASDTGMTKEEIAKVSRGVLLVPATAGSIVLAYNLPGVEGIRLSRDVYPDILLGKITNWNDPRIAKINPDLKLPDQPITVIYRSDGSGTTAALTKHLSTISPAWKSGPGEGKSVSWPVGTGAKGNEGITAQIQQTQGAIGYTEYGYATQNKIPFAILENKAGQYVAATPESASAALASVTLPEDFLGFAPDPEGAESYPIVSYSWILAYKNYDDQAKAQAVENVLKWGLTEGQRFSSELGYVPLPESVVSKVQPAVDALSQ
ncbi:MAG: phosphate ABC transporter substrate-binding protein PstS [Chroococcus sp. CMT-3BRIN-NPC107]|jgi:phosphate transport system substrate-binding protein|nr:phosphate ABC transporter substrate-binding protein PstS [Chroococcus sp. CMT-3BRIN-NPC107]